jgi:MFS family permease
VINWFGPYKSEPFVERNFFINTFDGAIYSFAMSFVALNTVMPVFVKNVTGSNIYVGLIPVLWTLGFNFPQIVMANYVRRLPYKKPLLLITALAQRLPWLFLAIFSWFLVSKASIWLQVPIFFSLFILAAVAGSVNLPGWFDLVAKVTPVRLRGRLFAARSLVGALLGIFGGLTVKYVLDNYSYPQNFSILFFLAFTVMMISYTLLFFLKETSPNAQKDHIPYKEFFRRIPVIIKNQKNYRNYLIADAMLISSLMADAFFTLNAINKFSLSEASAGIFTIIMMGSVILGNLLFGYIADKLGHKLNLFLASTSSFLACVVALTAPTPFLYSAVFIFAAFTITLLQLSRLAIIAEICAEDDRPSYVAITNMITSPFILLGVLGGWLANTYGYNYVFFIAAFFALISSIWFSQKVKEPRRVLPVVMF